MRCEVHWSMQLMQVFSRSADNTLKQNTAQVTGELPEPHPDTTEQGWLLSKHWMESNGNGDFVRLHAKWIKGILQSVLF